MPNETPKVRFTGPRAAMLVTFPEWVTNEEIERMMARMMGDPEGRVESVHAQRYDPEQTGPTLYFP